jgi:hypothetical protein
MTNEEKAKLLVLNMKRCIEIIESPGFGTSPRWDNRHAELKAKMHEVRRDSIALEKIMYPDWRHIHK